MKRILQVYDTIELIINLIELCPEKNQAMLIVFGLECISNLSVYLMQFYIFFQNCQLKKSKTNRSLLKSIFRFLFDCLFFDQ